MKPVSLYFLGIIFILSFTTTGIHAQCMQVEVAQDYVPLRSELIVEGRVLDKTTFWDDQSSLIYTAYRIEVFNIIKGDLATDEFHLLTKGGLLDNHRHIVSPEVSFAADDVAVFMANETASPVAASPHQYYKAWAIDQSIYMYDKYSATASDGFKQYDLKGKRIPQILAGICDTEVQPVKPFDLELWLADDEEDLSRNSSTITGFSPTTVNAGVDEVLTITGSNFGSSPGSLWFRNANSTNPNSYVFTESSQIDSWSNTQIVVRVPINAGTGKIRIVNSSGVVQFSTNDLNVYYHISSFGGAPESKFVRYIAPNSAGEVEYRFNSAFATNTAAGDAFERAMSTWRCSADINFQKGNNTGINNTSNDNTSVIRWSNGEIAFPTIGQYNGYFFTQVAGGTNTEWCADEFDIMFLPDGQGVTWHYGTDEPPAGSTDLESTALHEIGHALILGHVSDPDAVMYPTSQAGTSNREPHPTDLDGALYSMPLHQSTPADCPSFFALTPLPALEVTSSAASGPGTLSQAILDVCPDKSISFSSALTGTTIATSGMSFVIDKDMSIVGLGMQEITLSGNTENRIFDVSPDITLTLSNLKLANGFSLLNGGAIYNQGTTILEDVTFENNMEGSTEKALTNDAEGQIIIRNTVDIKE